LILFDFTWFHLILLDLIYLMWSHLVSLDFIRIHLISIGFN
jgi:hypothetical protein